MKNFSLITIAAALCALLLFSCTSDLEMPPPPDDPISSSAQVWNYCVYPKDKKCYSGSYSVCPGTGGELRNDCPYSSSSLAQSKSSSSGGTADNSSSSQNGQGNEQEYDYCVFDVEKNCLSGPLTDCPSGGKLSNTCPYNSSSSAQTGSSSSSSQGISSSSSSGIAGGSSSSSSSFSSSSQGTKNSSSSQIIGQVEGNVFTDPRDGKKIQI